MFAVRLLLKFDHELICCLNVSCTIHYTNQLIYQIIGF